MDGLDRRFEIHPRLGQLETQGGAAFDGVGAERSPQLREQRVEPGLDGRRRAVGPQRIGQLVAADGVVAVDDQVGEGEPALPAGQAGLEALAVALDHERTADLYPQGGPGRQGHANALPIGWVYNAGGGRLMAKLIRCECGFVARGDTDDEVIDVIRDHMRSDHPAFLDTVGREDLLGWIQVE